jgi:hypothetical protein
MALTSTAAASKPSKVDRLCHFGYAATGLALLAFMAICQSSSGEDPSPALENRHAEAVDLVRQLGDEQFSVRERATTSLIRMGLLARDALEEGRNHADREIRYRCERILSIVGELDFEHRLDAFAAHRSDGDDLPAWRLFRERHGDDSPSRALFVRMQEAEAELLRAVEDGPQGISRAADQRCLVLQQTQRVGGQPVTLGGIAALLFAASEQDASLSMQATMVLCTLCRQPTLADAMKDPGKREILARMMGQWIGQSQGWSAYQTLFLSMQYSLKEGLKPALALLENPGEQAYARQQAILAVAKLGDESHAQRLEALLDDATRCSAHRTNNVTFETQIRDVALVAILKLRKQDPKQFGFQRVQEDPNTVVAISSIGFENDDRRQEVFAKYRLFLEEQRESD